MTKDQHAAALDFAAAMWATEIVDRMVPADAERGPCLETVAALGPPCHGWTTVALPFAACTCGHPDEMSPALHAGTCPVWARHHHL